MNKLKVAIFGDSYADEFVYVPENDFHGDLPWVRMLRKIIPHSVTNFALEGSSFYYSAKLCLEKHNDYDKIIFIVTFPDRIYLHSNSIDSHFWHIANLDHLFHKVQTYKHNIATNSWNASQMKLNEAMPYLNAVRDYYLYVYNFEQVKLFHDSLYEKLERSIPKEKIIFIPVVRFAAPADETYNQTTLCDISNLDSRPIDYKTTDTRQNHLNKKNREILAEYFAKWIETGIFNLNIKDFVSPEDSIEQMFPRIDLQPF